MSESTNAQLVRALWDAFDRFDFDAAGHLLHDAFVCDWPQSRERIRGRDNFIAVNQHYPGQWRITVERLVASGNEVVTEIMARYGDQALPAISFFTLREGKIWRVREYWPDPMPAADWRAPWVERMDG